MNAPTGSPVDAAFLRRWLGAATEAVEREADHLSDLDSPIGDADHGGNMRRGFRAARTAVEQEPPDTPGGVLVAVGRQLISTVGGASGPLYGTLLRRAGKTLGEQPSVGAAGLRDALRAGVDAVAQLGGGSAGDKTMLDALLPFSQTLTESVGAGHPLAEAWPAAAERSDGAARATADLRPKVGRARPLAERSVGTPDAGATSLALCMRAVGRVLSST